ncbi:hypothetical protein VNO78_06314 [Psophocarpus tetragonolobus]|uniref:non-specific serine/threonine protein kinase n=1 Tax=Psophocarpus tetragonolobus TaxID=3891 RepID=A0AAN9SRW8_PSOTE
MDILSFMTVAAIVLSPSLIISLANDSIHVLHLMRDGHTLVSKGGKFELGFFSPGSSQKRYLGIWYKNIPIQTVVWVANRANPINDSSGILTLNSTGNLVLTQNSSLVWYTNNNSHKQAQNAVAVLLESGNLVIRDEGETNPEEYLWQSFDYPTDTLLPGMKLGSDLRTGLEWRFTAWKSPDDPSPGDINWLLKRYNSPEFYMMKGTKKLVRTGPWNGLYLSGLPDLQNNTLYRFNYVNNNNEIYYSFSVVNNFIITRTVANQTGVLYRYVWVEDDKNWKTYRSYPKEFCDTYGLCGPYGNCIKPVYRIKNTSTIVASTVAAICGVLLLSYFIYRMGRNSPENLLTETENNNERLVNDLDIPLFDLPTIVSATNDFSTKNKIGQGGFGPVYRGLLVNGQEIAVKTLSSSSGQGLTEFLNEVKLIAKLQHRNLVKLLGCCIEGHENILVYEYMPNGSLNSFIFDDTKGKLISWPQRFNIIRGIARGLMYLHQDSRLRIIHRDLKASNVLLDENLNPKISDFGTAKTFGGDQTQGNTKRIVGTHGYMAPEYAVDGLFSVKSDVFSFGIVMLEVICGNRNRAYYHTDNTLNLVSQAWKMWKENRAIELIDPNIRDSYVASEVLRCMHVSLLCVQQHPDDRPTMHSVILMLDSEMELVEPKAPGFISKHVSTEVDSMEKSSTNEVTVSILNPR